MTPADVLIYNRITQCIEVHNAAPCCGSYNLFTQPSNFINPCKLQIETFINAHLRLYFTARGVVVGVIMTGR